MPLSSAPLESTKTLASTLLRLMSDAGLIVDLESGLVVMANPAWGRLARRSVDETIGQALDSVLTLPDRELRTLRSLLLKTADNPDGVFRTWLQTAPDVALSVDVRPQFVTENGNELAVLVITTRHQTRVTESVSVFDEGSAIEPARTREQSALKLSEVFSGVDAFAWEFDWNQNLFTYVSPSVEAMLGYPRERWTRQVGFFSQVLHPDDREETLNYCRLATENGRDHTMEYRLIDAKGVVHHVRDQVYLKHGPDGVVTHLHGLILDITEKLQVAQELSFSKARYRNLFDNVPVSLWVLDCSRVRERLNELRAQGIPDLAAWLRARPTELADMSGRIQVTDVNHETIKMFRANSVEDFCNRIFDLFREDSYGPFSEWLLSLAQGQPTYDFENVLYSFRNERLYTQIRTSVATGYEQSMAVVYASVVDLTHRKEAELLRDGQRSVLETLASGASVTATMAAMVEEMQKASPQLHCAVFSALGPGARLRVAAPGKVPSEVIHFLEGRRLGDIPFVDSHDDSLQSSALDDSSTTDSTVQDRVRDNVCKLAGGAGYELGTLIQIRASGALIVGLMVVLQRSGRQFTAHSRDVVQSFARLSGLVLEHELDRRSLRMRTAELNSVFRAYPDAMFRVNSQGAILERYGGERMNESLRAHVAYANTVWELADHATSKRFQGALAEAIAKDDIVSVDFWVTHSAGTVSLEARFLPMPTSRDLIVVVRDVTQLKETEAALRAASDQFQRLFDQSPTAIFVESYGGVVLAANTAACQLHQMSRSELIGKHIFDLVPKEERDAAFSRTTEMVSGHSTNFEGSSLRSDGTIVPVSIRVSTIDYNGLPALLLHVRDITEEKKQEAVRKEQERQLAHIGRLTMMGQLVAGIAHEIRQPLWASATFADVSLELLEHPDAANQLEKARGIGKKLAAATRRANEITNRMLSFARKGQPERERIRVEQIVESAIGFTQLRAQANNVETTYVPGPPLPEVLCDRILVEQTVVNLLNNAYHALVAKVHGRREVEIKATQSADFIVVSIADNGPGLPPGVAAEKLFESFFTTDREGMGIGLALSRSFIREHGGIICAEPNASGGMTFQFTLRIDGDPEGNATSNSLRH